MVDHNWIVDFEAYLVDGKFWIKEIAILPLTNDNNFDNDTIYNLFVKSRGLARTSIPNYGWYMQHHNIRPNFCDYFFDEAIAFIQWKIGNGKMYVKGREKCNFLREYFNVEELPENLCSFKNMDGFADKCCDVKHSKFCCARRKVFFLRKAFNDYKSK